MSDSSSTTAPSLLHRALSIVSKIEPEEAVPALLLAANVFILLTAYYLIKPVREGLILTLDSGAQYKSYSSAAIAVLLFGAVPLYGRVAARLPRNRLVVGVTLFFAANLVVFYLLDQLPSVRVWLGIPFFLWVGIFNMMAVAQLWAFANDLFSEKAGKRVFPIVGLGGSLGAVFGARIAAELLTRISVSELMLVSAGTLVLSAGLTQWVHKLMSAPAGERERRPAVPRSASNGLALVAKNPYLRLIAVFTLLFTLANTNGEYVISVLVSDEAREAEAQGALGGLSSREYVGQFYGEFYFWVNLVGVVLQALFVSRLLRWGGVSLSLSIVPVVALASWTVAVALPILAVIRVGKIAENATDYSINNTARQTLWLPTDAAAKYAGKQAVDTVFVRLGDVASAGLVFVGTTAMALSVRDFAIINLVIAAAWLWLTRRIARSYTKATNANEAAG